MLVGGVLLLRRIQGDGNGFFVVRDVEDLSEGLVAFGDDLDADFPLRDRRDVDFALLIGAQFECGADRFPEFHAMRHVLHSYVPEQSR